MGWTFLHATVTLWCITVLVGVVNGSTKKGGTIGGSVIICGDLDALSNVTWWYNYGQNIDRYIDAGCPNLDKHKLKMTPMVFSYHANHTTFHLEQNSEPILGFNEPNHKSQSNMTPEEAARWWPEIEKHANGRLLVSPAAAPCHDHSRCLGDTLEWFDQFFHLCQGCRVDYVATHSYMCDTQRTMHLLSQLYHRYHRKVWLTEFACTGTTDYHRQLNYMKEILPRLEEADYVYRYSWFVSRRIGNDHSVKHSASLLHTKTPTLTSLGQYYVNFQGTSSGPVVG